MPAVPTKERMRADLANTKKEIEAYQKILEGYYTLQALPENEVGKYRLEVMKFEAYLEKCKKFYKTIQTLYANYYGGLK